MPSSIRPVLALVAVAIVIEFAVHPVEASAPTMGPINELSATPHDQFNPEVAYDHEHGQYLLVWDQEGTSGAFHIVGRLVSAEGTSIGNDILISDEATRDQRNPGVAYDASNGQFLVVWYE